MFNFIDFAAVIVFLVTMFDDSTQLVTVPRSSSDPIAELCRALVVLKRERSTSARSLSSAATDMLRKSTGMVAVSTSKL